MRLIDGNELADLFLEFFPPGVVEEIRQHSKAHATEHGNDLERIVQAVRKRERDSDRPLLNPGPKHLSPTES